MTSRMLSCLTYHPTCFAFFFFPPTLRVNYRVSVSVLDVCSRALSSLVFVFRRQKEVAALHTTTSYPCTCRAGKEKEKELYRFVIAFSLTLVQNMSLSFFSIGLFRPNVLEFTITRPNLRYPELGRIAARLQYRKLMGPQHV